MTREHRGPPAPPARDQFDDLLRPYVEGNTTRSSFPPASQAVDIARLDLRAAVDSIVPAAGHIGRRERVMARMKSGSWEIEALERDLRATIERAAAEKLAALAARLAEEIDKRKVVESEIKTLATERRKFWGSVIAGVMILLIAASVTWAVVRLNSIPNPKEGSLHSMSTTTHPLHVRDAGDEREISL